MAEETRYIHILRESLKKKERLLYNLQEITKQQADYIDGTAFEPEVFDELMDVKEQMIDELMDIEDGFAPMYERIRIYMQENQKELADDIREMQNRIREITTLSASIQALEERNRQRLEVIFSKQQQDIQQKKRNTEIVNTYYQSMAGSAYQTSMLDTKK